MDRFRSLDDVQLAIVLSLVARNHCLITTEEEYLDHLQQELERIGSSGFGLYTAIVKCTNTTTPEEFVSSILIQEDNNRRPVPSPVVSSDSRDSYHTRRHVQLLGLPPQSSSDDFIQGKRIANFIIARDLDLASNHVQMQALNLIQNKSITTKALHHAPSPFIFIGLIPKIVSKPKINVHLSDHFFISHFHDPQDDLDHESITTNDTESSSSSVVIRKIGSSGRKSQKLLFSKEELNNLSQLADEAYISIEIKRYIMDIIVFLRMHRAVAGGITAKATKDFELLVKCLCPLNGLEFATPSLVELAVYKVYAHRIVVADKRTDRSIMWGSKPEAVEKYLAQVDANMIIDNVLEDVRAPL